VSEIEIEGLVNVEFVGENRHNESNVATLPQKIYNYRQMERT
jgi:hypothetical protein